MNESEKQFSFTRAASSTSGGAEKQIQFFYGSQGSRGRSPSRMGGSETTHAGAAKPAWEWPVPIV